MDLGKIIEALEALIEEAEQLKSKRYDCPELSAWQAKAKSLIRRTNDPDFLQQFEGLYFQSRVSFLEESETECLARNQPIYTKHLTTAQGILRGLVESLQALGMIAPTGSSADQPKVTKREHGKPAPVIRLPDVNRHDEAKRFLDGAQEKKSCADILKQNFRWACAVQMYQQAMELSMKAVMILCIGQYRTEHDFNATDIGQTLRRWSEISKNPDWPNLDACFAAATRWASTHSDSVYGYSYGRPSSAVMGKNDADAASQDASNCMGAAQEVARVTAE